MVTRGPMEERALNRKKDISPGKGENDLDKVMM